MSACHRCLFSPDSKSLFLVKSNRDIDVFSIPDIDTDDSVQYETTINTSEVLQDSVCQLKLSHCGKYLICAGLCCNIGVWKLNTQKKKSQWKHLLNLPKYKLPPTALAIHRNTPKLVAAFADSKVFEYDLSELKFTCSTNAHFVANQSTHIIRNIVLDPRNENIFILQNDSFMFVLQKQEVFCTNTTSFQNVQ